MPSSDRDEIYNILKSQTDDLRTTNANAKRQYEINEWTSNNKLDTLFFYQLLLITLTITAPLLYLNKKGLLPSAAFYGIVCILGIAVVLTLLIRYQYTVGARDLRYWNRRRFAQMGGPPTSVSCDAILASAADQSVKYGSAFKKVSSNLGNEIVQAVS
jgi:hypothetical protein